MLAISGDGQKGVLLLGLACSSNMEVGQITATCMAPMDHPLFPFKRATTQQSIICCTPALSCKNTTQWLHRDTLQLPHSSCSPLLFFVPIHMRTAHLHTYPLHTPCLCVRLCVRLIFASLILPVILWSFLTFHSETQHNSSNWPMDVITIRNAVGSAR